MKKRVFIYIRVSTDTQAEEGYSLGEQEARLRKLCEANDWILVRVYTDGGFSGGDMNRPALQQMFKAIEKGEADLVLVDKLDRLSRSQFDTLYMIQEVFDKHGVGFVSRNESFDTSTPFGKAMVGILAVFAELERARIKERMADGREGRAKEGKWKGGPAPTGYTYDPESGNLQIDPYEAEQVKKVIEMYNNRVPIYTIMQRMNKAGYRTKYGDWTEGTIKQIATSRLYLGEQLWKGEWIDAGHDPINTEEIWLRSQAIKAERDKKNVNYRAGRRYASPLAGLIRCGVCGGRYHCKTHSPNRDGSPRRYYMCYSRAKTDLGMVVDPNCRNKNYRDRDLEAIIFAEIRKLKSEPLYISQLRESVDYDLLIEAAEKRLAVIEKQISKMMDLYAIGSIDLTMVKEKMQSLADEKKGLEEEIEANKGMKMAQLDQKEVTDFVELFEEVVLSGDTAQLNNVISDLIEFIEIENENIKIHWNF